MPFPSTDGLGYSQWYVNCAHVNIIGSGGGTPGPTVRFPEAYGPNDAFITMQYPGAAGQTHGLTNYPEPGPAKWDSE